MNIKGIINEFVYLLTKSFNKKNTVSLTQDEINWLIEDINVINEILEKMEIESEDENGNT